MSTMGGGWEGPAVDSIRSGWEGDWREEEEGLVGVVMLG